MQTTLREVESLIESSEGKENIAVLSQVRNLLNTAKRDITDVIEETEEPLLVAAAIGITYMLPTHEVRRQLQDIRRIVARVNKATNDERIKSDLDLAWRLAGRADDIVAGLSKVLQKGRFEKISLENVVKQAQDLMRDRLETQRVKLEPYLKPTTVNGSERLLVVVLLNLLENSAYWLGTLDSPDRRIRIITDSTADGSPILIVSDNGPGLSDEIEVLSQPFVTRKSEGMGLGLYIVSRIALNHKARLRTFERGEVPNLLSGANIGLVFPRVNIDK